MCGNNVDINYGLFTLQTVLHGGRKHSAYHYANLPLVGVHVIYFSAWQLILGFY